MKKTALFATILFAFSFGYSASIMAADIDGDKKRCERYKKRLSEYREKGVKAINPKTGKIEYIKSGEDYDSLIKDTKENVEIFCSG